MGRPAAILRCPFCDSTEVELVAPWGGQIITTQCRCRACNSYFEAIRSDFAPAQTESAETEAEGDQA
jgi:C4-type Zn-finger protein